MSQSSRPDYPFKYETRDDLETWKTVPLIDHAFGPPHFERAKHRIYSCALLLQQEPVFMPDPYPADWPPAEDHYKWICNATIEELSDWFEQIGSPDLTVEEESDLSDTIRKIQDEMRHPEDRS